MRELDPDDWDLGDLDDDEAAELREEVFGTFLDASADVRYFGATMSVDMKGNYEGFEDYLPDHFTGPVQFSPAKTLHPVTENEEYNSLTSVIATGEGKEQGGFDLDDHRIQYGFIAFHGLVDENGAADTKPPRRTSSAWTPYRGARSRTRQSAGARSAKSHDSTSVSSTRTRASTSVGSLAISISTKSTRHLSTNFERSGFHARRDRSVSRLGRHADRIARVRVVASDVLDVTVGDEVYTAGDKPSEHGFYDAPARLSATRSRSSTSTTRLPRRCPSDGPRVT